MRKLFLLISLSLLLTLFLIYLLLPPKIIHFPSDLKNLHENQKVIFQGKALKTYEYEYDYRIILDNNLSFYYPKPLQVNSILNKTLEIQGKISIYLNNTNINGNKMKIKKLYP
ncbi:MAG: hypothetical protein AABX11_03710 [Nanoarchaeota archaeon]